MTPTHEMDTLPPEQQASIGHKRKTHRGRRSRGKGAKPSDHHAEAKGHLQAAQQAATPQAAHAHLFRALSSLKKAVKAAPDTDEDGM